ncbi:conserved hypothetical protein [Desulfamplus magnetovallimortis]|uniref:Radical SAM core domain-containing protein n=2 Tax=Desulfamplus magnetovallimortis TaxID=1246637 RepID=A0A1W1H518_9BACT|nr:conserved hypothetical protein [Desulfamplus magnetovallimortis]
MLCGQGKWSCLFVNNICNAHCFYCPSTQKKKGIPGTNNLDFPTPDDYVDYLKQFDIEGVSFSGGEPTMTMERVTLFLKTIRKRQQIPYYIWMYTNGILITEDKLKNLADLGLDEIRFDLSADRYNIEKLEMAAKHIPHVTVEIPAIPEDISTVKDLIPKLYDAGVNFMNLHQLRCTKFNREKLIKRGYTFLHGPGVTVLETELAALELMKYALENKILLPINYCSFTYRNQFQKAGSRRRNARLIRNSYEDITDTGFIRSMSITGDSEDIRNIDLQIKLQGFDQSLWHIPKEGKTLFFNSSLWPYLDDLTKGFKASPCIESSPRIEAAPRIEASPCIENTASSKHSFEAYDVHSLQDSATLSLHLSYFNTALKETMSYNNPFKTVKINNKRKVFIERRREMKSRQIRENDIPLFAQKYLQYGELEEKSAENKNESLNELSKFEEFKSGLMEFFV